MWTMIKYFIVQLKEFQYHGYEEYVEIQLFQKILKSYKDKLFVYL